MKEVFMSNFNDMTLNQVIVWFFIYSFLGWCMECCVIRKELGYWENRGFAKLPFCIIYGFGCLAAFIMFAPFQGNVLALFIAGAVGGTAFEYLTARVMIKLFGELWWNYDHKKFNYKGILCLESSIGWGLICILLYFIVNSRIKGLVFMMSTKVIIPLSYILVIAYAVDFIRQFHKSREEKKNENRDDEAVSRSRRRYS